MVLLLNIVKSMPQKGYTYDELSVPPRISDIRAVISDLDEKIGAALE